MSALSDDVETRLWLRSGSSKMQLVLAEIKEAALSTASVLITGETGTGKGVVAELIHRLSPRCGGPLVTVDTTLFPKELLESELFGMTARYLPGTDRKEGLVHSAATGTLLFDEIGDMATELQPKLLRFVQHRICRRVGSTRDEKIDARCLFATNCNLEDAIRQGRFRQDLYFRIRDLRIRLPPLRERLEDIVPLARHLCERKAHSLKCKVPQLSEDLERLLLQYDWPGNIRELEACIGVLVDRCRTGGSIGPELLPEDILESVVRPRGEPRVFGEGGPPREPLVRSGPPMVNDPTYQRVPRNELARRVLTQHLQPRRVAVLLQTHRGGGRSLARQIAAQSALPAIWLVDSANEQTPPDLFFRYLTRDSTTRDLGSLDDWLRQLIRQGGPPLIIQTEPHGPEELLESVAAIIRSVQEDYSKAQFLLIGGERLLRLRKHERYAWLRLLSASSMIDVPDLTIEEVGQLLRGRGLAQDCAAGLHEHTGGHPWLIYELLGKGIVDPQSAVAELKVQLRVSGRLERHLKDSKSYEVIHKLLRGEPVSPLGDRSVRRNPERYAESRLYFDCLLTADSNGQTQFRCPAVKLLFEEEVFG